ncbi:MAG: SDR family NAD(P)-dependent oxidoreductase [Bacteroidota bacterium]|nr:SDR family NAD(P)-dependent oxidoreductase [Bacteroidota bacterium]MDX5431892.1 SDR family NAD(P)-dependent oxidoreductase [Bacteroidota bacterium]MDX5470606.1 SDR family NAD(P)-dependent oxidoreductase [Bacteroidota bacterium]
MKFKDKVWVVTGAGSGMGRELTLQLLHRGARVALVDLRQKSLEESLHLAGEKSVCCSLHELDISDKTSADQLPSEVIQAHGTVDGIINNAGIIQPFVDIKDLEQTQMDHIMAVNFFGPLYLIKAFLPFLLERPEAHLVNISSMGGYIPFPGQTLYSASKAALKLLTEGLYAELKSSNVQVTVVHPGAVNTNISQNSGVVVKMPDADTKTPPMLEAHKAAQIILKGIEKNKFRVLVGRDARMLDLFYRISPKRAIDFITKMMGNLKQN